MKWEWTIIFLLFHKQNTIQVLMLFQFITSPEFIKPSTATPEPQRTSNNKLRGLQQQISKVISCMPAQAFCRQAALNTGLPPGMTDFDKIQAKADSQNNLNALNFLLMQLKTLLRQATKLKDTGHRSSINAKRDNKTSQFLHRQKMSILVSSMEEQLSCKAQVYEQQMMTAMKNEMAFRVKLKRFYSTEKIQRKEEQLKKRVERVKDMNKRAFKIYKNYKQKEEKSVGSTQIDNFIRPEAKQATESQNLTPATEERKTQIREEEILTTNCQPLVISIPTLKNIPLTKCKTPSNRRFAQSCVKTPFREINGNDRYDKYESVQDRFTEVRKREVKTRQRKRHIQQERQANAIMKLIKKQEKRKQLENTQKKQTEKENKPDKDVNRQPIQRISSDLEQQIKTRCEQTMFKKELQLRQRVNRIRQQLKQKEERMERHRLRREREHEQEMQRNESIIRTYNARIEDDKQQRELQHQQAIKNRFQTVQHRDQYWKMVESISKLPDADLLKQMQKIKQKEFFKTLKSIVFLHIN